MIRDRRLDILVELVELCQEIIGDIKQQLTYYKASVYKNEAADAIKKKVDQLRLIAGFFADDIIREPFRDFDAIERAAQIKIIPGECSFSVRVTRLIAELERYLANFNQKIASRDKAADLAVDFGQNIRKHRNELLGLCRFGSRHRSLFQMF